MNIQDVININIRARGGREAYFTPGRVGCGVPGLRFLCLFVCLFVPGGSLAGWVGRPTKEKAKRVERATRDTRLSLHCF